MSTATPARPLGKDVTDTVNRTYQLAHQIDPAIAEQIKTSAAGSFDVDRAVVVVVGEVKQGKSTLVNALLRSPGLSPVDVSVATLTYIAFAHADTEGMQVYPSGGGDPFSAPLGEIDRWGGPSATSPASRIEVSLDAPWLGNVVLIDTPGAGGLNSAHAELALSVAGRATALLFVTDAHAPMTQVELDFLSKAASRVNEVVFVLTKIRAARGWATVLEENRANLARVAPRFADAIWIPADGALAAQAQTTEDPALRAELEAESGVDEVLTVLRDQIAPKAKALASANVVRFARHAVDRLANTLAERMAALEADPALEAALKAEQARLAAIANESTSWGPSLDRQLNLLRIDATDDLTRRLGDARQHWTGRLRGFRKAPSSIELDQLYAEVQQHTVAMAEDVLGGVVSRIEKTVKTMFGDLVDTRLDQSLEQLTKTVNLDRPDDLPPPKALGVGDLMEGYWSHMMAANVAGMIFKGFAGGAMAVGAAPPVALVAAVTVGAVGLRMWLKKDQGRQADVQQAVLGWLNEAGSAVRAELDRNVTEARWTIGDAMRAAITQRAEEVKGLVAVHQAALHTDQSTKESLRKSALLRRSQLDQLATSLDALLERPELSVARAAEPAS